MKMNYELPTIFMHNLMENTNLIVRVPKNFEQTAYGPKIRPKWPVFMIFGLKSPKS